ncbi:ankyrin repeat-containing domain protein [Morchella snyderi]|nr:ankyrin repeat-containing domain protein [Morchella snyderi]
MSVLINLPIPLRNLLTKNTSPNVLQNLDRVNLSALLPYLAAAIHVDNPTLTPFLYACKHGYADLVKLFMLHGLSASTPNAKEQNKTALHYASEYGHDRTVSILLNRGIFVDAVTTQGWTPLHYAAQGGHVNIVKMLVEHGGADMDKKTRFTALTPLHIAIAEGKFGVVPVLVEMGANINAGDVNRATALHYVALSQEARMRAFDSTPGLTKNVKVSLAQRLVVFKFLVQAGADMELGDNYGKIVKQYISSGEIKVFEEKIAAFKTGYTLTGRKKRENERKLSRVRIQQEEIRVEQEEILRKFLEGLKWTIEVQENSQDEGYEDEGHSDNSEEESGADSEDEEKLKNGEHLDDRDYEQEEECFRQLHQKSRTRLKHRVEAPKGNPSFLKRSLTYPFSLVWVSALLFMVAVYLKIMWPDNERSFYY